MFTKETTSTGLYVLPRVNLLPPEIGERKAVQRSYRYMGIAVVAAAVTAGTMYVSQAQRVDSANKALGEQKATDAQLRRDRVKLQTVQDALLKADAHENLLVEALARRVSWSRFFNTASLNIPENVWLTSYTATVTNPSAAAPGTAAAGLGTMQVSGFAFDHKDVAGWLESVTRTPGYVNSYLTTAADVPPSATGTKVLVGFTSTAQLSTDAFRPYVKPAVTTP